MQSNKKKPLILIICILIVGISISIPIFSAMLNKNSVRNYGSLILAVQVEEKENSDTLIEAIEFQFEVQYNSFEREKNDKHLEFLFEIKEIWKLEEYIVKVLWIRDTVRDHYWVEKIDNITLMTFQCGLLNNGTIELNHGKIYNLTCWELGTGPDPSIGK
ncbi:MAG: hypothetical protein ACFFC3_08705 [Candidatus Odinarchaeota archaeon]